MISNAPEPQLWKRLAQKGADKERIAADVVRKPQLLDDAFAGLSAEKAAIKYGCAKVLRSVSERAPALLYPWIELFIELLESDNTILQWEAIRILGNLARVDSKKKIDRILARFLRPISGPVLITAANTIKAAAEIALAKPQLAGKISSAFRGVEKATYETPDCRDVALGHVIKALERMFSTLGDTKDVLSLVRRQLENARAATSREAGKFLKRREREAKRARPAGA